MTEARRLIALLLLMMLLMPLSVSPAARAEEPVEPTPLVGWLELSGELHEGQLPLAWMAEMDAGSTMAGVLEQLDTVAGSDRYAGLVIYLDEPQLELTQVQALGEAIGRVRAAGRTVLVFAEYYTLADYLLATYADRVLLQHKGEVELHGLAMEELYLTGLLEKIGVQADMEQVGQFKGANETMTRHEPSEPWNQNINALLDDLYGQILGTLAQNRRVTPQQVEAWMAQTWTMTDAELVAAGVVDELADRDLLSVTETSFGPDFAWDEAMGHVMPTMQMDSPLAIFSMLFQRPPTQTTRPTLAVIHANGPITGGDSSQGAGLFGEQTIGSRSLIEALGQVRDDEHIQGAVIQLDSPGGSALASEVIWQAIRDTAQTKPVYVSVGPMAASGGYYMAAACDRIYVQPQSIVGSIGVVGGKLALGGLYAKLGITVTQRRRGPMAGVYNSVDPFTIEQREQVRGAMRKTYDQFVERVRIGRGTRLADAEAVAEGRLFTGQAAVANGMADATGTLEDAIADLAESLQLDAGAYDVLHLPPALSFEQFLADLFQVRSPLCAELDLARRVMPPAAWSNVRRHLTGLLLLRDESVLTLLPQAIRVK